MAAIEVSGPQGPDRVLPEDPAESKETSTITADNKSSGPENPEEQILSKDESITSPSDLRGESTIRLEPLDVDADRNPRPQNVYPHAHAVYYGGYENSRALWDEYSQFFYSEGMELGPPGTHPLIYHTGYGYSPQMPFGPYSPVTPLPLVRRESQMYSSPESPLSGPYYHQPGPNTMAYLNSPSLSSPSNSMRSVGPGPSFLSNGGSGGGGISTNLGGQYFHDTWQGFDGSSPAGLWSDRSKSPDVMRPFTPLSPSASPFGRGLSPFAPAMRPYDRGTRRDRTDLAVNTSFNSYGPVNASVCSCNGPVDFLNEQNRGPRAAVKPRSLAMAVDSTSSVDIKPVAARVDSASYNKADFKTDYDDARFFVIKSYSEDNVHKSIKYGVWASTPNGNRKLDTAYSESKAKGSDCPIFLLFSVNASAHFCGVAEMAGAVDFEKSVDYWQQDKWSGHFPVKWHVIKDVPNSLFRHIILENNDNKPVTNSRDTQEVKMEQGLEMLTIFKGYESCMSILDDFDFYEGRERAMGERKAHQRQQQQQAGGSPAQFPAMSVAQMQKTFAQAVRLDEKKSKKDGAPAEGAGGAAEYFPNLAGAAPLKGG